MAGINIDSVVRSVLLGELSSLGVSRVPFYFGSVKSTGMDSLPFSVDYAKRVLIRPDVKTTTAPYFSFIGLSKLIRLSINPEELVITPYIRIEEIKTGGGRTYYHWLNEELKAMEAYTMTMKGVTGNLFPGNQGTKLKLYWWTKLREMTYEPYWFYEPETGSVRIKKRNYQFIIIKTIGIPTAIMFVGFYRKPITINERAANQYNIPWDFEFVIEDMYPSVEDLSSFMGANYFAPDIIKNVLGEL